MIKNDELRQLYERILRTLESNSYLFEKDLREAKREVTRLETTVKNNNEDIARYKAEIEKLEGSEGDNRCNVETSSSWR